MQFCSAILTCASPVTSAVECGSEMLELDCHMTLDGHVVVSHDENLLRQTGHDVNISSLKLQVNGRVQARLWRTKESQIESQYLLFILNN